jgi:arylsulfatase A-like enzyme
MYSIATLLRCYAATLLRYTLYSHNHWIKYTNWETDVRVPMAIHHPKAPHTFGKHTPSLVEHVDLVGV